MYIESAESPDLLKAVRELFLEYAQSLDVDLCFQNFSEELAGLPGDYARPSGYLLLASENGHVLGCGALRRVAEDVCELKRLYVRPAARGKGVGIALIRELVKQARAIGYRRMRLDTLPSMTKAIELYRALGFKEIASHRYNPVPGSLFLEADLSELFSERPAEGKADRGTGSTAESSETHRLVIRPATPEDKNAVWHIMEAIVRAGETYTQPRDMTKEDALGFWFAPGHEVFVAEEKNKVVGTYFLRANQKGGGDHVANCGYMTEVASTGRGVARAMCAHSLEHARARGFRAMQFNFVVSTNERAVRLWQSFGFETVGTLPKAFCHPRLGYVDVFVMYRAL